MASPSRPWDKGANVGLSLAGLNQRQASLPPDQLHSFIPPPDISNVGGGVGGPPPISSGSRPPLPPRPTSRSAPAVSRQSFNGYNSFSSYNGYAGSPYSGYGGLGSIGGYGVPNRYGIVGTGAPGDNGFIHIAEESSRQAFESIESIVHAFGSVSMMLESTYSAVYSSFRAVLGVAEHFSRMKSHFAQIFSALAVVRTLKWILRKLLYLIGLRSQDPSLEAVWRAASKGDTSSLSLTEADLKASRSSWPIVMFLAVVFGGPYLIWRLLSSLVPQTHSQKSSGWKRGVSEHYAAVAVYNFEAGTRGELSFQAGQRLFLAPKDDQPQVRGWLLASNGTYVGVIPANYIKILGLRQGAPQPTNSMANPMSNSSGVENQGRVAPRIPSMPVMKPGQDSSVEASQPANPSTMHTNPTKIVGVPTREIMTGQGTTQSLAMNDEEKESNSESESDVGKTESMNGESFDSKDEKCAEKVIGTEEKDCV